MYKLHKFIFSGSKSNAFSEIMMLSAADDLTKITGCIKCRMTTVSAVIPTSAKTAVIFYIQYIRSCFDFVSYGSTN